MQPWCNDDATMISIDSVLLKLSRYGWWRCWRCASPDCRRPLLLPCSCCWCHRTWGDHWGIDMLDMLDMDLICLIHVKTSPQPKGTNILKLRSPKEASRIWLWEYVCLKALYKSLTTTWISWLSVLLVLQSHHFCFPPGWNIWGLRQPEAFCK